MSGPDTIRGIGYQQAQAVVEALAVFDREQAAAVRVEGVHDVIDVETLTDNGEVLRAMQVKIRSDDYTWGKAEILAVFRRWMELPVADTAEFEFLTDGRLGPTGEQVRDVLELAQTGDLAPLASLLQVDERACQRLRYARVRTDPVSTGALLLRAERQVGAMLPSARTVEDLRGLSRAAVDQLFRLMMERAGHPDPGVRTIDRREIADVVGIEHDLRLSQRWPGELRNRYIQAAAAAPLEGVSSTGLLSWEPRSRTDAAQDRSAEDVVAVLATPISLIAGRTGTGKSTACRMIVRDAAASDRVALLAHAEGYLPGRLEALAADSLSAIIDEDVSTRTGRQLLADSDVTLIIDGVSEVPTAIQNALADDLRVAVATQHGSRVVLVGRDLAALRSVLPSSAHPEVFEVAPFQREHRLEFARRAISEVANGPKGDARKEEARTLAAQVEHALGDAASNPLMCDMATQLVARGVPFEDRATLYGAFLEHLAERTGTVDIVAVGTVLGVAFSRLLDEGRRYADPYEWRALIDEAASSMPALDVEPETIETAARRSGTVTTLGYAQTVVPIHDSMADYLAASAHARGAAELPTGLSPSDEQRLAFYAEIRGVDEATASLVTRDLPFLAVSLARHDQREWSPATPAEVALLLETLLSEATAVGLWQQDERVVAMRVQEGDSRWLSNDEARSLMTDLPATTAIGGPLDIAVHLWRQRILQNLATPDTRLPPPRARSLTQACEQLRSHAANEARAVLELVDEIVPDSSRGRVLAALGPLGIKARVSEQEQGARTNDWPVSYEASEEIDVARAKVETRNVALSGRSSVGYLASDSPTRAAAKRVTDAINRLVGSNWI